MALATWCLPAWTGAAAQPAAVPGSRSQPLSTAPPSVSSGTAGAGEPTIARPVEQDTSRANAPAVIEYSVRAAPPTSVVETPRVPAQLTLRDALLASFERSGTVSASRADVETALAMIDATVARKLPQIEAFVRGGVVRSGEDRESFEQAEAGLTLSMTLLDWGAGSSRIAMERARAESAAARLDSAVDDLGFRVVDTFFEVLLQRDQLRVADWSLKEARRFQAQLAAPVQAGALPASLAANAAALVAQQEAAVTTNIRALRQAEAQLAVLVGFEPAALVDPLLAGRPFGTAAHAVQLALARSPIVAEAAARTRAAEAEQQSVLSDNNGRLTLDAEAAIGQNVGGTADANLDGSVSATYRIAIFDGGLRQAQAAGAASGVAAAGGREVAARHTVETAVRRAWAVHETAGQLRRQEERAVGALELALQGFADEIQAGQRQFSELPALIAQSSDAQKALATYYYGEQLAVLHLYRHTGDAWAVVGVENARKALVEIGTRPDSLLPLWLDSLLRRIGAS